MCQNWNMGDYKEVKLSTLTENVLLMHKCCLRIGSARKFLYNEAEREGVTE